MKLNALIIPVLGLAIAGCSPDSTDGNAVSTQSSNQPAPQVLVDPTWIAQQGAGAVVIDLATNEQAYLDGHVPGARLVDWRKDISDPAQADSFELPPQAQHEALMSRLGITNGTTVVLYDDASSRLAARMYWTLKYFGHDDIRILDGGKDAWERSGLGFSVEIPDVESTDYQVRETRAEYLAGIDFINENLKDPGFTLVDARSNEQYTGEKAGTRFGSSLEHLNKGHIYGAQNVLWSDNFNEDGTFKSPQELRKLYAPHGVTEDKTVVTYCNVGIQGSSPWFVLSELLGYEDVRLYDGSMTEWANDNDNYMVMGKHCM